MGWGGGVGGRDALEGKGPQRRLQKRRDRRLEEVAKAVGGGYCRLQIPLSLALGVRGTVAGRLGALERGGGGGGMGTRRQNREKKQRTTDRTTRTHDEERYTDKLSEQRRDTRMTEREKTDAR